MWQTDLRRVAMGLILKLQLDKKLIFLNLDCMFIWGSLGMSTDGDYWV